VPRRRSREADPQRRLDVARMHLEEARRCGAHQSALDYWESQVRHWESQAKRQKTDAPSED